MHRSVSIGSALFAGALLLGCNSNSSSGSGGNGNSSGNGNGGGSNNVSVGTGTGSSCATTRGDIALSSGGASQPAIAWNGHAFGVAYQSASGSGDIAFALVDGDGNVKSSSAITTDSNTSTLPSVVVTSSGFLVLWQDNAGNGSIVKGRNVDANGAAQGSEFSLTSSGDAQARPGGVAAQGGVAIAWADTTSTSVGLLSGTSMQKKTSLDAGEAAAIAANGDDLGVVWAMSGKLGFAHLSAPYSDASQSSISVDGHVPRIASDGKGGFYLAWEDWRTGSDSPSIFATHVDSSGSAASAVQVQSEGTGANYPDIAFSGDHAGVVYYQFRDGPPAIFFTQLNADLSRDGLDLQVSGAAASGSKYARVAWSGSVYGVVFADVDGPVKLSLVSCK